MKVLYVLGSFYPAQSGGPNNTVYWAASELAKRGVDVTITSLKDGLTEKHISDFNLKVNCVSNYDGLFVYFFSYVFSRYFSTRMYFWLFSNIKKFDAVMLTSIFFPFSWYSAMLCICFKVPFSIAPRGELEPGALKFKRTLKYFLLKLFIAKLFARAKCVIVTSNQEKRYSKIFLPKNTQFNVLYNFQIMPRLTLGEVVCRASQKKHFLYIGRLHPKKGIENLIDAFVILDGGKNKLIIAGDGDTNYVAALKEKIHSKGLNSKIVFVGHVEGDEKSNLYKTCKVMILPSFSENFGNVVVEALSFGLPVIASTKTPWQMLKKHSCGYWVDNSPTELATHMEKFVKMSSEEYVEMSCNAFHLARDMFDVKKNGAILFNFISRLKS